uniref:histidine kinase n=1 Tax=uncultured Thiotrichaceae bacterium TaxID=298394 RepID=A0A6S6TB86_9GAMM|nr:MAG: Sensory histidine kinase BaeS [uncultured Thiotrichaceae bacterium]
MGSGGFILLHYESTLSGYNQSSFFVSSTNHHKMKLTIFGKLYLAIFLATSVAIVFMVVVTNWNFEQSFAKYEREADLERIECLAKHLAAKYPDQPDLSFLGNNPTQWLTDISIGLNCDAEARGEPLLSESAIYKLSGAIRLLDENGVLIKGAPLGDQQYGQVIIPSKNQSVGSIQLILADQSENSREITKNFKLQQGGYLYLIALFSALLSLLVALVVVRQLVTPVKKLTEGATSLLKGEFATQINVASGDELGDLSRRFNQLSAYLQRNEELRGEWIADISHELRTPISVLRSETEAMLDGVRPPNLKHIRSLHAETMSLKQLVDDLYQLSLSDAGDIELVDEVVELGGLLDSALFAAESLLDEKQITVVNLLDLDKTYPVRGDESRLYQLFTNLLGNSHRYTDAGGSIQVAIKTESEQVVVEIADSAPGVPDDALPRLFERLFRVDKSRSRALGGSGLGLSICRNLVEMHGGKIEAHHSDLGGLLIRVRLPLLVDAAKP